MSEILETNAKKPSLAFNFMTTREQITFILNDKIKKICQCEYKKANPQPVKMHKLTKTYSLPLCVNEMVKMISECADQETSSERLKDIYHFATSGEVFELSTR